MTNKTAHSERWLTPAQMSDRTGVSLDTLRYYENEGLLQPIARAANGHRRYSADDVLWVEVLRCLRDTGMSISQLRHYCSLGQQGESTEAERLQLLQAHRQKVIDEIARMHAALNLIEHKISFYTTKPPHSDTDKKENTR